MKTHSGSDKKKSERLFQIFERHKKLFLCFLLFALVWMAFVPALKNDFTTFDDQDYVTDNFQVQQGLTWQNFKWAFTTTAAANWHPLTWLSLMLDCEIFGLAPWGFHLTNILLHASGTILLFLALQKMTRALWRSFFVAALFGLHPLHVESVAWIAERKDVLSGLFFMLTILAYAKFVKGRGPQNSKTRIFYGLALLFFVLGLLSKPMLVTLPFVLLLLDFWPLNRMHFSENSKFKIQNFPNLLAEKIPFFVLSAICCAVTFLVQKNAGAVAQLPLSGRLENTFVAYMRYLGKIFWPAKLSAYYPIPVHWPPVIFIAAIFVLAAVTFFIFAKRNFRYPVVGWFWFLGMLIPVIGLVQVGGQSIADRYTYLPSIGVFILIAWGGRDFFKKYCDSKIISVAAIIAPILICLPLTQRQVGFWQDGETLFRHALAVTPENYMTHYDLALALDKNEKFEEGVRQLQIAIQLNPNDMHVYNNLGFALQKIGRDADALTQYQKAVQLDTNYADAHVNLGILLGENGNSDEAIRQLEIAEKLKPDSPDAYYNLGNVFVRSGRLDDGIAQYKQAIKLNPIDFDAQNNLGVAYSRANRLDEATTQFLKAINLDPDNATTYNNLGIVLYRKGLLAEAIAEYQKALQLNPDYAEAQKNLDTAIKKQTELRSKY